MLRGMDDDTTDSIARFRADVAARIMRYGYTTIVVGTGECSVPGCTCPPSRYPYAYSLGLHRHDHPEIVMFGVPLAGASELAGSVFDAIQDGHPFPIGREFRTPLRDRLSISLDPVPARWVERDPGRVGQWFAHFGERRMPEFVQVVWSDLRGRMPWDVDADPLVRSMQPLLADDPIRVPEPPRHTTRHRRRAG